MNLRQVSTSQNLELNANFNELPPPFPPEYLATLYGIVISSIVGWSIPSIIGWIKTKKMIKASNTYHKRIISLYDDSKLNHNDIVPLDQMRRELSDSFAKGKISYQHYQNLKDEISAVYEEIYDDRIDSLNSQLDTKRSALLDKIKKDVARSFAKGKLNQQHYDLLDKKIETFVNNTSNEISRT